MKETFMDSVSTETGEKTKELKHRRIKRSVLMIVTLIGAIIVIGALIFPFGWIFYSSFKQAETLFSKQGSSFTFQNYKFIFRAGFFRFLWNSVFICTIATLISTLVSILASYVFSRKVFKGKKAIFSSVLLGQMFPWIVLVNPLYIIFAKIGLINNYLGITFTYIAISIPFSIYLLVGYLNTIPRDLDEAAIIDGCSQFGLIWRIIIPVILPGVVAVATYSFIQAWNEYLFALAFLTKTSLKTLPLGLNQFFGEYTADWGSVMAASALTTIPTLLLFLFIQRKLTSGLTAGAIKQ